MCQMDSLGPKGKVYGGRTTSDSVNTGRRGDLVSESTG